MSLRQRSGSVFLTALAAWLVFSKTLVWLWFNANRKALAEAHCVNRNRPDLRCNGACYFGKLVASLDKAEVPEHQTRSYMPKTPDFPLCACHVFPAAPVPVQKPFNCGGKSVHLKDSFNSSPPSPPPETA